MRLLKLLYDLYDADNSGCLSVDEIRDLLSASGSTPEPKLIEELLRFADASVKTNILFHECCVHYTAELLVFRGMVQSILRSL